MTAYHPWTADIKDPTQCHNRQICLINILEVEVRNVTYLIVTPIFQRKVP